VLQLTPDGSAVLLPVKVVPGASRTRFLGVWEGRARIAVAAAPEKGKANAALAGFLAKLLSVRKRDVIVVSGHTSPRKTIRIEGVDVDSVRASLQPNRT